MAAYEYIRANTARPVGVGRAVQFIQSGIATLWAWNEARETRRALGKLSDRELDDIGLIRGDIDLVAESGLPRR